MIDETIVPASAEAAPRRNTAAADFLRLARWLAAIVFAASLLAAMVGAFVGLDASSYWIDELFTAWVVSSHAGLPGLLSRLSADTHSPLYYLIAGGWAALFGSGETALRSLSAILACASLVVFMGGLPRPISWPARLFAAAVAAGGAYWFFQSQDARDYALALVCSASLCGLYLRSLDKPDDKRLIAAMIAIGAAGTLVNYYVGLLLAAVGISRLLMTRSGLKTAMLIAGVAGLVTLGYVLLVAHRYAQFDMQNDGWTRNDWSWYQAEFQTIIENGVGRPILYFLALAVAAWLLRRKGGRLALALILPPVGVLAMGVISSAVFAPNFVDRHFLIASPFLWALLAVAFDYLTAPPRLAAWAMLAAVALVIGGAFAPMARVLPRNEEWRASARWVSDNRACAGQPIPVLSGLDLITKNDFGDRFVTFDYRYYLTGSHQLLLWPKTMADDGKVPAGIAPVLEARARGGCPILLWTVHGLWDPADARDVGRQLSQRLHVKVRAVPFRYAYYQYGQVSILNPNYVFVRED